jgi:hypothetical protein
LGLQEVENRYVLRRLSDTLSREHRLKYRIAFVEGFDTHTEQDVAVFSPSGLREFGFRYQSRQMWESRKFHNVNKHLVARFEFR